MTLRFVIRKNPEGSGVLYAHVKTKTPFNGNIEDASVNYSLAVKHSPRDPT